MMNHANPIQQKLMRSALRLGKAQAASISDKGVPPLGFVDGIKYKFLDDAVLSKIRARFGGNLRAGFVAGAACPKEIIDFMDAIGIPVCEGYGLTETSVSLLVCFDISSLLHTDGLNTIRISVCTAGYFNECIGQS